MGLSAGRLKELLHYDSDTGAFTWLAPTNRRIRVGTAAGSTRQDGYVKIVVDGSLHYAHRLAWLYTHGDLPPANISHIDRCRANNRIANLRAAIKADIAPRNAGFKWI